jgi:2-dehydropantoate 2-reductase
VVQSPVSSSGGLSAVKWGALAIAKPTFAILGAGAIGTIVGAHLAHAGHSVLILARGQRARQIEQYGLRIKGLRTLSQPVAVLSNASQFEGAEILLVAVKARGTAAALEGIRHADIEVALSLQNGVSKDENMVDVWGAGRVLGALADTSGELLDDGEVLFTRNERLSLGELSGVLSARAQRIAKCINDAGVHASAVVNIQGLEWSKFAAWTGLMALSIITRAPTWKYLIDANTALLVTRLVREIARLAASCGIPLSDEAPLPVQSISQHSEAEAISLIQTVGERFRTTAPGHIMSSLQDLRAGRHLELEETLGYALHKADELEISLPVLGALYPLLVGIDAIECRPGSG